MAAISGIPFPFFAVSSTLLSSPDEPRRYVRLVIYPPLTAEEEQSRQAEKLINRGEEAEIRIESERQAGRQACPAGKIPDQG